MSRVYLRVLAGPRIAHEKAERTQRLTGIRRRSVFERRLAASPGRMRSVHPRPFPTPELR